MTSPSTDRRYGLNSGAAIKVPTKAATTANVTLSGEQTVDGVALVSGDRVLVKNQTTNTQNGVYVVDTGTWERDVDFNDNRDLVTGTIIMVLNGTQNGNTYWRLTTTDDPVVIGTSAITFAAALAGDSALVTFLQGGTGAVSRSMQSKAREIVSVTDFGAVGDGIANDSSAITAAITYLVALGGGICFFPPGTYKHGGITLKSEVAIVGAGANVTHLKYSGSSGNALDWGAGVSRGIIRDIEIGSTGACSGWAISGTGGAGTLFMERVGTDGNIANGIKLYQSTYARLDFCRINGSGGGVGIYVGDSAAADYSSVVEINGCYVAGSFATGIKADKVTTLTIDAPTIEVCTTCIEVTDNAIDVQVRRPHFEVYTHAYVVGNTTMVTEGSLQDSTFTGSSNKTYAVKRPVMIEAKPASSDVLPSGSSEKVTMDTVVQRFSSSSDITLGSNLVTIVEPAYYDIEGVVGMITSSGVSAYKPQIKINGSVQNESLYQDGSAAECTFRVNSFSYLTAGDTVGLYMLQASGANRTFTTNSRLFVKKRTF